MKKIVRHAKTLIYYDGPVLFEARDPHGGRYLGMAMDTKSESEQYAVFGVSPERLRLFINGALDLLDLITGRKNQTWYVGVHHNGDSGAFQLTKQATPLLDTEHLPDPGLFLRESRAARESLSNLATPTHGNIDGKTTYPHGNEARRRAL